MKCHKRQYNLSAEAELIIQSRTGPPQFKGGPASPSSSMALNTIILRYAAMINEQELSNQIKFDPEEIEAIIAWFECRTQARQMLSLIERPQDHEKFLSIIRTGNEIRGDDLLDRRRRNALMSILIKNISASEMFALTDLGLRRLTMSNSSSSNVI